MSAVQDLILDLPEPDRAITERLRSIIVNAVPEIKEKLSYGVPFFHRYSNICYIWPGSIGWMGNTQQGVEFGFWRGNLLSNEQGLLTMANRKQVANVRFMDVREIDEQTVREVLYEAVFVDEEHHRAKLEKKRSKKS